LLESISNIQTPHELPQSWTLLVLEAYWKEYSFRLVMRRSIETNSSSLKQMPGIIGVMQYFCCRVYWDFSRTIIRKDMSRQMTGALLLQDLFCLMRILFLDQH
jgi:hypothetical protein